MIGDNDLSSHCKLAHKSTLFAILKGTSLVLDKKLVLRGVPSAREDSYRMTSRGSCKPNDAMTIGTSGN